MHRPTLNVLVARARLETGESFDGDPRIYPFLDLAECNHLLSTTPRAPQHAKNIQLLI